MIYHKKYKKDQWNHQYNNADYVLVQKKNLNNHSLRKTRPSHQISFICFFSVLVFKMIGNIILEK